MSNTIVINGKTYASLDEMPPDVRAQWDATQAVLADKNQNGVPDILDTLTASGATMIQSSSIVYQGKTYASADELPPEGRAAYEAAMGKLADENHDGVPDIVQKTSITTPVVVTTQMGAALSRPHLPPPTTINMGPIIVLGIVSIGLALIVAILLFLVLNKT